MNEEYPHEPSPDNLIPLLLQPQPTVVAIEGGPCGGKTTLIDEVRQNSHDRQVVVLPEVATEKLQILENKGRSIGELAMYDRPAFHAFETDVLATIVDRLKTARQKYLDTDTIIIADRCDVGAYLQGNEYGTILGRLGLNMPPYLSMVDKLIFMPSVARVRPELYDTLKQTNPARYESLSEAQSTCKANLEAVSHHPELHIAWGGDFKYTVSALARTILQPEVETELRLQPRGNSPVMEMLVDSDKISTHHITQSYHDHDDVRFRLRKTLTDERHELYTFTVKQGEGLSRTELQRNISAAEYRALRQCRFIGGTICKTRYNVLSSEEDGKRLWSLDRHYDRRLPEWTAETSVHNEEEANLVSSRLIGKFACYDIRSEAMARDLKFEMV